jgi:hypothetical protein
MMAEEMQSDNLATQETNTEASETPVENTEASNEQVESKESQGEPNLYDDKRFREEADKIRESTKHKVSKQYERDLQTERQRIAELQSKVDQLSTPPDSESVYDNMLGDWRPKNMSADEYAAKLQEVQQQRQQQEQQQQFYRPMEERAEKATKAIGDFQPVMSAAVQNGIVAQDMVMAAAQEDGGLEILYDLVKSNSPKLVELQKLPAVDRMKELWKLSWAKSQAPAMKTTSADEPVTPENTVDSGNKDYASMDFKDGYQEFLKERSRGRG